jgi:hypothetical protein
VACAGSLRHPRPSGCATIGAVPTLYDILGAPQDADGDQLRHAYYRAARRLHPDVNLDVDTTDEMRRLNRAWAVLGDPDARLAYDLALHDAPHDPAPSEAEPSYGGQPVAPLGRLLRPSVAILAVLLVIFVVTAYAGPPTNDRTGVPAATTPAMSPAAPAAATAGSVPTAPTGANDHLGQCLKILPGYDAVVPCMAPNDGQVVSEVRDSSQCPAGSRPYQLAGLVQIVCLEHPRS